MNSVTWVGAHASPVTQAPAADVLIPTPWGVRLLSTELASLDAVILGILPTGSQCLWAFGQLSNQEATSGWGHSTGPHFHPGKSTGCSQAWAGIQSGWGRARQPAPQQGHRATSAATAAFNKKLKSSAVLIKSQPMWSQLLPAVGKNFLNHLRRGDCFCVRHMPTAKRTTAALGSSGHRPFTWGSVNASPSWSCVRNRGVIVITLEMPIQGHRYT